MAPAPAASASTLGGPAVIDTATLSAPLVGPQGSTQTFGIGLPAGAACDGDTATQGYEVVSYMVPDSVYPDLVAQVTFTSGDPNLGFGYFNLGAAGSGTAPGSLLGPQPAAAGTGQIGTGAEGPFQWGPNAVPGDGLTVTGSFSPPYHSALIPTGQSSQVWESGIACINSAGVITDYWNADITFTVSTTDPNGYTWTPAASPDPLLPEAPLTAALPIGGLVMVVVAVVFVERRRRTGAAGSA